MSELMSQVLTPEVRALIMVMVVMLIALYVLVVIWVARDAYQRGTTWWAWGLVALIPIIGVIAYVMLRPSLLQLDREEQELEVAIKQRQIMKYGECANCGYPVESEFVMCPNCHQQLKNMCPRCEHALEPTWTICPYCATPIGNGPRRSSSGRRRSSSRRQQAAASTFTEAAPVEA